MIGHTKSDNRMDRCWLKGAIGDALHALSCAAGYNIRWLLRAIVRLGIKQVFLRMLFVTGMARIRNKFLSVLLLNCYAGFVAKQQRWGATELVWKLA